ncbi:MAG TPA: T9SS type A sorting domain-containing protein [Bacteroidota bacterium]|nr:T9SS type A sorting domain-containing protein [Bacteroidota bacterium]
MKRIVLVFSATLLFPLIAAAQIPNASFETWANGLPSGWTTTNISPFAVPVTETTIAHSGSAALQGTVVSLSGVAAYPPLIWSEFPISQRYATFSGWYMFTPIGGDSLYGWLIVTNNGSALGYGFFNEKTVRGSYLQFNVPITYFVSGVPDSCEIFFGILGSSANNDTVHVGSTFRLDDLALSGTATAVAQVAQVPHTYALEQNYPNPFNPSTVISYDLASTGTVRLTVYDILGREVERLVDGIQSAGSHQVRFDGNGLSSGVYIYRLQSPGAVLERKMVLAK